MARALLTGDEARTCTAPFLSPWRAEACVDDRMFGTARTLPRFSYNVETEDAVLTPFFRRRCSGVQAHSARPTPRRRIWISITPFA